MVIFLVPMIHLYRISFFLSFPFYLYLFIYLFLQPIIVVHQDDEGARLRKNTAVSNLPYMRRNPAV